MPCFHYCQRGRHSSICHRRAERRKGALFHSVQLSKSSHHAHAIPGQTMATHGQDSQSTAPSDRPTVQNNSLLDTPLERRIDKRMAAYSNKFSAPGIISYPTDVDTDSTLDFLPSKEDATWKAWMPCLTTSSKSNDSNESTLN
ncbi:hypothetical protein D6D00_09783 [Aureobasidium pullulans]|nr:hypothetical protein D6D00_09783 [Aureobasidium pullulans]